MFNISYELKTLLCPYQMILDLKFLYWFAQPLEGYKLKLMVSMKHFLMK